MPSTQRPQLRCSLGRGRLSGRPSINTPQQYARDDCANAASAQPFSGTVSPVPGQGLPYGPSSLSLVRHRASVLFAAGTLGALLQVTPGAQHLMAGPAPDKRFVDQLTRGHNPSTAARATAKAVRHGAGSTTDDLTGGAILRASLCKRTALASS